MTFQDDREHTNKALEDDDEPSPLESLFILASFSPEKEREIRALAEKEQALALESCARKIAWLQRHDFDVLEELQDSLAQLALVATLCKHKVLTEEECLVLMKGSYLRLSEVPQINIVLRALTSEDPEHDLDFHKMCQQIGLQKLHALFLIDNVQLKAAEELLETNAFGFEIEPRALWKALFEHGILRQDETRQAIDRALANALSTNDAHQRLDLVEFLRPLDPDYIGKQIDAHRAKQKKSTYIKWGGGALIVLALLGYWWMSFTPPSCSSTSVRNTLRSIVNSGGIEVFLKYPGNSDALYVNVSAGQEAGYNKETRTRGCIASMMNNEATLQIGFEIFPSPPDSNKFSVQVQPASYVYDTFHGINSDSTLGAPIGRKAMTTALKAGFKRLDINNEQTLKTSAATMQSNDILNVYPTAKCAKIEGDRYRCPVEIDYNDSLLRAYGRSSMVTLKDNFTFIKNKDIWTVSDEFSKEFTTATVNARAQRIYGDSTTQKPPPNKKQP